MSLLNWSVLGIGSLTQLNPPLSFILSGDIKPPKSNNSQRKLKRG